MVNIHWPHPVSTPIIYSPGPLLEIFSFSNDGFFGNFLSGPVTERGRSTESAGFFGNSTLERRLVKNFGVLDSSAD